MGSSKATQIKISLLKCGVSQASIARDLGVTKAAVNRVINGRAKSKRIEDYLATIITNRA